MPKDPKMARLEKLSPETRKVVEEELSRFDGEQRVERLLTGNTRLLDAFAAVWEPEDDNGAGIAHAILTKVVGAHRTTPSAVSSHS